MIFRSHAQSLLNTLLLLLLPAFIDADCDVDILLVVDASSSVRGVFEKSIDAVRRLSEIVSIGPNGQRIALIEYSGPTRNWVRISFGQIYDNKQFTQRVDRLLYLQGLTLTGKALNDAYELLQDRRLNIRTAMVIITDGYSQDKIQEPLAKIQSLSNVLTYSIAVSEKFRISELEEIAGDPNRAFYGPTALEDAHKVLKPIVECDAPQPTPTTRRPFRTETITSLKTTQPTGLDPTQRTKDGTKAPTPRAETKATTAAAPGITTTAANQVTARATTLRPERSSTAEIPIPRTPSPSVKYACDRIPYQTTCGTGFRSQFTLRWYFNKKMQRCCSYPWGYCRGEVEIATHPSLRTKADCEAVCIRGEAK